MAQQFLDGAQVATRVEQVSGEGMAQGMGRGRVWQAEALAEGAHQGLHLGLAEAFAPYADEKRVIT